MRRAVAAVAFAALVAPAPAHAGPLGDGKVDHGRVEVGIVVTGPGSGTPGRPGDDAARPLVHYLVSWSVDPTPAQTGSLDGLCLAPGGTTQQRRSVIPATSSIRTARNIHLNIT